MSNTYIPENKMREIFGNCQGFGIDKPFDNYSGKRYDPLTAAVISSVVVAAVGTGVSVQQSTQARKSAGSRSAAALKLQREQVAKLEESQDQEAKAAEQTRVRTAARERQRRQAAGASGRSSTIRTSPLGVQGSGGGGSPKTLLGT